MDLYEPQKALAFISSVLMPLPDAREGICYGTPAFYVQKKLVCRLKEDGETLVLYHEDRDEPIIRNPEVFFVTDHYLKYSYVLVNLPLIDHSELEHFLIDSWKARASARQLKAYSLL